MLLVKWPDKTFSAGGVGASPPVFLAAFHVTADGGTALACHPRDKKPPAGLADGFFALTTIVL